jgi:hypothetical protein
MKCKFSVEDFLLGIHDSMELDSGQCVASLEVNDSILVTINVEGYVRVVFNDVAYKASSQMPDELTDLFHEGKAYDDERVYIDNNNWFEAFIYYKNPDYNPKDKKSVKWLYDNCWSTDVLDGDWKDEADVFSTMMELAKDYLQAHKEN